MASKADITFPGALLAEWEYLMNGMRRVKLLKSVCIESL